MGAQITPTALPSLDPKGTTFPLTVCFCAALPDVGASFMLKQNLTSKDGRACLSIGAATPVIPRYGYAGLVVFQAAYAVGVFLKSLMSCAEPFCVAGASWALAFWALCDCSCCSAQ